jgi:energy-coupling factor transport system permease protein
VSTTRLPRMLHPGAWWLWAMGMAAAASRTTNPLLLGLIAGAVCFVVSARRTEAPWSRGFRLYVYLGLAVIVIRVVFRMLLDAQYGAHVLFTLPEVPLPEAAAGIRIGGEVSAEGLLLALFDGMRLAVILLCVGAANVLANPKRLLKAMPAALHEVGVAITVALSVASQLLESGQRVRRARRLRGAADRRRWHVFREIAMPVMTDALDRSLLLAAAMDSRGYGRTADLPRSVRARNGTLLLGGLVAICIGAYGMLDATAPPYLGVSMLVGGMVVGGLGVRASGARVPRTRYRPDPWRIEEWAVGGIGVVVAGLVVVVSSRSPLAMFPSVVPLRWPELPWLPAVVIGLGCLPAWIAPPVTTPVRTARPVRGPTLEAVS